ncbi:MAG: hypothetical protein IPK68_11225 [Bdellovibrionales bacterium]|nr:hypothetical protein [Bdellovibrionales bacterium]
MLHANYEQAAKECGLKTVAEYFKKQFASEVEAVYQLTNVLVDQIDAKTGKPKAIKNTRLV